MPLERGKEVADDVEVALLLAMLMFALRDGFDGEDTPFSTATLLERRRDDAGSRRFPAMNVCVAAVAGHAVSMGVEHGNKEALNAEDEFDVLLVPVVTPLGYGNEVFAVQLHAMISLLVGFPISL